LKSHAELPSDLDILTLELVRNVSRGTDNLPANFGVSMRLCVLQTNMYQIYDMTLLP